ncbi:LacI family DNA-binding transcriptional regulator [Haliscomenobacter sp.]|uniref:LacI family DNA-binding transcriptional regulator n=1 Tax=Haliscomenobacter sp. TaxID=2717303 RepID=UPI003BA938DA
MEPVTIKDIAKALKLSTSTVSRALRDSYEINAETKRIVQEYATKMNYRPNPIAQGLKENRSRAIAVIVPEIANNFFSEAITGIEDVANNLGYDVVIFQSHESYEKEVANVRNVVARRVDGLLISISNQTKDVSHLSDLHERGFPLVFFDRVSDEIDTYKVVADNFSGAFMATDHLLSTGKRYIAHITSAAGLYITKERLSGYKSALEKHGIPYDPDLVHYCRNFDSQEMDGIIENMLSKHPRPDAIFTASDRLALACFEVLSRRGIRCPEDLALIGFTNLKVAHLLSPALTTVTQPAFEIGQAAVELLIDLIEKKKRHMGGSYLIKLPTELVVRASSV